MQRLADMVRLLTFVAMLLLPVSSLLAQKAPGLGYVYPPAIRAGQTADVQIGGYDFTVDLQWFVGDDRAGLEILSEPGDYHLTPPPYWHGPRASMPSPPVPREVSGRIVTASDAKEGFVRCQVANASGSSSTALFYVSRTNEITESRSRDLPQVLPALPVSVSGRLSRLTEVDRYRFTAAESGTVTASLMARPFGSDLNGVLQVRDTSGQVIADYADTEGIDGEITFATKAGEDYTVCLNDVDFRGDRAYVYRLSFLTGPRVVSTIPAAGQRGTEREVQFHGIGLASGQNFMESVTAVVRFPTDPMSSEHTHLLQTAVGSVPVKIPLSDVPEMVLSSSSDAVQVVVTETSAGVSESLSAEFPLPAGSVAITGTILPDESERRFSWPVQADEHWLLKLESLSFGGDLDMAIEVLKPDGTRLAENDNAAGTGTTDSELEIHSGKESGTYTVIVRSHSMPITNARNIFRLLVQKSDPDFLLTSAQQISLPLGGDVTLSVQATRRGGFDSEIVLTAEGLPAGVSMEGDWKIPAGQTEAKVKLKAAADAAVVASVIHLFGTAPLKEQSVRRPVMASVDSGPAAAAGLQTGELLLAMTMPAPFEIQVVDRERQRDVHRGTTYLAELKIVRQEGFQGDISIEMSAQQDRQRMGMRGPILNVPAGETTAWYPVFLPEWLSTDLTRRIVVHGVAAISDPKGNRRYVTKAADARITMIMEGALLKLAADTTDVTAKRNTVVEIPITALRSSKLPLPAKIELLVPAEAEGLIRAEPLTLDAAQSSAVVRVSVGDSDLLQGKWEMTIQSTILQDNRWPVVSQAVVQLDIP